jgi:hypothetical protein
MFGIRPHLESRFGDKVSLESFGCRETLQAARGCVGDAAGSASINLQRLEKGQQMLGEELSL